jgi:hypothetical protein
MHFRISLKDIATFAECPILSPEKVNKKPGGRIRKSPS